MNDSSQNTDHQNTDHHNTDHQTDAVPKEVKDSRSPAEKISFLLALGVLIAIISGVGYLWVSDRNQAPPVLQVSAEQSEQREGTYYVPFTVKNSGGKTAASVQVIAELRVNDEIVEWGEQSVDFLSREETSMGAFLFVRNPADGELTVRVASYSVP